jgi:hypothetical protein
VVRRIDRPEPGFFKLRLVRGGPFVAAVIFMPCPMVPADPDIHPGEWCTPLDRSRHLEARIDGRPAAPDRVWIGGRPIDSREYRYLIEGAAWDRSYAPEAPAANPTRAIDLTQLPPIF